MSGENGKWRNRIIGSGELPASEFLANPMNWRIHPKPQQEALEGALNEIGWIQEVVVNQRSGNMIDGHLRVTLALRHGDDTPVPVKYVDLSPEEEALALATIDPIAAMAAADAAKLDDLMRDIQTGEAGLQAMLAGLAAENGLYTGNGNEGADTEPQVDRAAELAEKWGTAVGQVWTLGDHRLAVGDCTDPAVVEAVMRGERAVLCHADPPYGMGKEKDGIANDNLYRDKLDTFQMQWWGAARRFIEDNGSVYIWGNAEDLWRLWYVGGLRDSERLTLRNEIVWDKQDGTNQTLRVNGRTFQGQRSHYQSERCLFFMLGEQGFNNNADNYWEGWEPIRGYLKGEADKMGITPKNLQEICGVGMYSHWFTESQWTFITREHYAKLQAAAAGNAFKREYDDLKREYDDLKRDFYATRAYFDNTHDNMTDVWQFPRVQGDERWGHATPKPVPMIERIVKSSAPVGAVVYSPFLGSGTDIIAAENLNRRDRAIEIDPGYAAVCLQRYLDHTGKQPELLSE